MKTLEQYFAELKADPNYHYSKAVGDAGIDLLAATYGIEVVVANLKEAEDEHAVHVAYYNDVVLPEIERGSTNSTRVFSSDSFGETEELSGSVSRKDLEEMVVIDNLFVGRLASVLVSAASDPAEVLRIAQKLQDITERVDVILANHFGDDRYAELYSNASTKLG